MGEGVKTIIFALIALAVAAAAVVSRPKQEQFSAGDRLGPLFEKLDETKAAGIKIVKYDEELGQVSEFKVTRDKKSGAWVIPSNAGYPADAEDRIRDATLMLVDLEALGVASEVPGEHKLFGVVSPDAGEVKVGDEGVGLLLTFEDDKGQAMASLVIGNKVKDSEDQRFVRIPSQDAVYAVKIDPEKLSTKFEDWIEKDLLQLSSFDIEDVSIKNYSVDLAMDPPIQNNFNFAAQYKDAEWKLVELTRYSRNQPIAGALGPDEELNKEKLNDLKTAVDNLEIVNVFGKPEGLGRDLKAGEDFMEDGEGAEDLFKRGFYLTRDRRELLSASGEVHVGVKDGVEYVLRFGKALAGSSEDEGTEQKNRYLFAMARVDMSKLPSPEMEEPPKLPEGGVSGPSPDDASGAAKDTDSSSDETAAKPTAADEAKSTETTEPETTDAAEPAEVELAEGDAKEAEGADAKVDKEAEEAEIMRERERISKENERKLNDYNEKVKKAKEKVAELNTRFGDWYYVVSEEQCEKIFLGLDKLITKKESEDVEGDGVDAFRALEGKGLETEKVEEPTS
ncbi:MAG: DUF4340 domain-containing protein [Planctomycetes bacterium]|nr:DUF4340 domain-containing protein [Planctomycetota bacterium]MBL7042243.1 DUF4340 domain-containing protein [Pirellulaceae bacterium]